jgi:hypothetical protein
MADKIEVCEVESHDRRKKYSLRATINDDRCGQLRFKPEAEFSKHEADYRAMILSSRFGWDCGELPTVKCEPIT